MAGVCVTKNGAPEQAPTGGAALVELWNGLQAFFWPLDRRNLPWPPAGPEGRQPRTTLVRMVSGCTRQGRYQTHRARCDNLLRAHALLDRASVEWLAARLDPGCHQSGRPLRGLGGLCG